MELPQLGKMSVGGLLTVLLIGNNFARTGGVLVPGRACSTRNATRSSPFAFPHHPHPRPARGEEAAVGGPPFGRGCSGALPYSYSNATAGYICEACRAGRTRTTLPRT
jgi:hypothetical protein